MSTPQSVIHVCSDVRLDPRYEHSIYFASQAEQSAYFAGKVVKTFSAYSYIRRTWTIKVQSSMNAARTWNYLFFQNPGEQTFYYFITGIEYVNDSTVELSLEMDVLQTYLFSMTLLPCFVERQHVTSDGIGEHTVEEGLDVGELVSNGSVNIDPGNLCIMVMSTINPNIADGSSPALPYMYNRVFSGVKIWAVAQTRWAAWGEKLEELNEAGQSEAIVAMWMYPMQLVKLGGDASWTGDDLAVPVEGAYAQGETLIVYSLEKQLTTVNGYKPKNNKLFCYPYNFVYCTNNTGNSAVYKYERFSGENMGFSLSGSLAPDGGVHLTPRYYNGLDYNYHEGMTLNGYPSCAWNSDIYKLWLAQNQGQNTMSAVSGALKIVGGVGLAVAGAAATSTGVGAVVGAGGVGAGITTAVSGAKQIAGLLAQNHDKDVVPPQAKGTFSSSVNITNNMLAFTLHYKSVTTETARIIDDYFTMYGYRINRVQTPNIKARKAFTYVKTIGCQIRGRMCTDDMVKIESIFDNGITFWKDGNKIADYSQDNSIK